MRRTILACFVGLLIFVGVSYEAPQGRCALAQSFQQNYTRGKVLLSQKLYIDAVREFIKAINTPRGRKHFGAHYFLAVSYYRFGNITQSMKTLALAKGMIKNNRQRDSYKLLKRQTKSLFGRLRIVPEVDPDAVGRLMLKLEVKDDFSHPQKKRAYRIIRKFWSKKGIVLKGNVLYLPKGDYRISISRPQCLSYGLTTGNALTGDLSITDSPSSLALKAKQSCQCEGGQVLVTRASKKMCTCPKGSVWSTSRGRCEIPPKNPGSGGWAANNWGWILFGVALAGGAGAGVAVFVVMQNADRPVKVGGNAWK